MDEGQCSSKVLYSLTASENDESSCNSLTDSEDDESSCNSLTDSQNDESSCNSLTDSQNTVRKKIPPDEDTLYHAVIPIYLLHQGRNLR